MEEVKTYVTFKIATYIANYWFPILVPIGWIGNTLSFIIMLKRNNRKISTCVYMAAISVNDNFMMYTAFHYWLNSAMNVRKWHLWECKFVAFGALFALQNCTFLILAMTVDKYIAIKWPHRATTYSTPRRAKLISVVVYLCAFTYNIPNFFLSSTFARFNWCLAYAVSSTLTSVFSWFSFVLNAIIPFTLLIHMNNVIVKTVRKSRQMFGANGGTAREGSGQGMDVRQKNMKNAENQLTIMLLLVTTLFLILLCPAYCRFIYLAFSKQDTPFEYAKSMILYQVTAKLYTSNSGINFFLYCISGQKFRKDLKEILCCCDLSRPGRKNESQSSTTEMSSVDTNIFFQMISVFYIVLAAKRYNRKPMWLYADLFSVITMTD